MRKLVIISALAVVLVLVLGLHLFIEQSNALNIEGPSSAYLAGFPAYLNPDSKTKIFLVSAQPRYGFYKWNDTKYSGGEIHQGDPCFILNITVRNDYTKNPIGPDTNASTYRYNKYVELVAFVYDKQGIIDAADVTQPITSYFGGPEFKIEPEETKSIELYLATDKKDIRRYEIYVTAVNPGWGDITDPT